MKEYQLCFTCAFWADLAQQRPKTYEVLEGKLYQVANVAYHTAVNIPVLTTDHHVKMISLHDQYGEIPQWFQHVFPDTCTPITLSAYKKIQSSFGFKCPAKGCWDRRTCFWYNSQLGDDWNVIPPSHQAGAERCGMYLHKLNILAKHKDWR